MTVVTRMPNTTEPRSPVALPRLPQCTASISAAIADQPAPDGAAAVWALPAVITEAMRRDAVQHAGSLRVVLQTAANQHSIAGWLMRLGLLVAGQMTADDVKLRVSAYGALLRAYPDGLWTMDTLESAGRRFTFFPAFAELTGFLDAERGKLETALGRCLALSKAAPRSSAGPARMAHRRPPGPSVEDQWIARARAAGRPDIADAVADLQRRPGPCAKPYFDELNRLVAPLKKTGKSDGA